jgi:DNA repair exonuclease SbcCD ATPase subunit
MHLDNLRIQNIRNISDATLGMKGAKLVVIKGKNHEGKTSVAQSISLLFCPSTDGLDPLGRGFAIKIKRDQPKGIITGDITGTTHTVRRTVTLNRTQTGRDPKMVCLDDEDWIPLPFGKFLQDNQMAIMVALNTDHFLFELNEADQKALLSAQVLPATHTFPPDKITLVNRYLGEGAIDFSGDPLRVIEKAYKKLFDERTIANRQVRDYVIPDPVEKPANAGSLADLEKSLREVRAQEMQLEADQQKQTRRLSEANAKRARLDERIKTVRDDLRGLDEKLNAAVAYILSDAKHKEMTALSAKSKTLATLTEKHRNLTADIEAKGKAIARLNDVLELGKACPTCGQAIDETAIVGIINQEFEDKTKMKRDDDAVWQEMKSLGDIDGATTALFKHDQALQEKARLEGMIAEKNRLLTSTREELGKLPTAPKGDDEYGPAITEARRKIDELQLQIRPMIAAEERVKEIAEKKKALEKLQTKAKDLDDLVKYFDKDGIKATLIAEHIGAFTKQLNIVLAEWGYSCAFNIDPYEFIVTDTMGIASPVKELSGSERLMFTMAMQCAVSAACGFKIIVCDRIDTFLPAERANVGNCLWKMLDQKILDQVFLLISDESTNASTMAGTMYFGVEKGNVKQL